MATSAQFNANQANAQHSTGPRTLEGKSRSAANSHKEGLTASTLNIPDRDRVDFDLFQASLTQATLPQGPLELEYFQRLLTSGWILRRARALEVELLFNCDPIYNEEDARNLQRIARYRRDLERSYDRALKELRQLQSQRATQTQPAPTATQNEPNLDHPAPRLEKSATHKPVLMGNEAELVQPEFDTSGEPGPPTVA